MDTGWLEPHGPGPRLPRDLGEPLRVGFIGSLVPHKGLIVAVRAIASMQLGAARLHIHGDHSHAGDPSSAAEVGAVVEEAKRIGGGRIIFHGRFAHDDLATIHSSLDVLVVPSLWQEAYGLTVREAHLAGTPVIGSRIGGIAEGVNHGVDGLLFEPGNAGELKRLLESFVEDPSLGPRLAAAAPRAKTGEEEAREMEWRYRQVIGKVPAAD